MATILVKSVTAAAPVLEDREPGFDPATDKFYVGRGGTNREIGGAGGGGTVTTVSVASANGFAGTVADPTTTPAITLSTTVTGLLKGDGTAISAAVADTDYATPAGVVSYVSANYSPLGHTHPQSDITDLVTDLAAKQPLDATLTAFAALTIAANSLTIGTGGDAFSQTTFAANRFPARASTGDLEAKTITDFGLSLVDDADASAARTTLGLVIGTHVQAFHANLSSVAGLTLTGNAGKSVVVKTDETGFELATIEGGESGTGTGVGDIENSEIPMTALLADNLLINGDFAIWQRNGGANVAMTDDAYNGPDRWYSLIQGSGAFLSRQEGTSNSHQAKIIIGSTSNRCGLAQIVESQVTVPTSGKTVLFQVSVRPDLVAGSGTMDIRVAILAWNGTRNAVTSEIVNDWTSGTFTTGNFFASTSLALVGTAKVSATHDTWTDLSVSGTVPSNSSNLIVFIWTEDLVAATNDYVQIAKARLVATEGFADGIPPYQPRHFQQELLLCQRYYRKSYDVDTAPATATTNGCVLGKTESTFTFHLLGYVQFMPPMRTTPTMTLYNPSTGSTSTPVRNENDATNHAGQAIRVGTASAFLEVNNSSIGALKNITTHFTAEAEL